MPGGDIEARLDAADDPNVVTVHDIVDSPDDAHSHDVIHRDLKPGNS